jgi:hypothetical protein
VPAVVPRVPAGAAPWPDFHELLRRHHPSLGRRLLLLLLKLTVHEFSSMECMIYQILVYIYLGQSSFDIRT